MALIPRKKATEHRRDRDCLRKALSRFLVVLSPVTSLQLFSGPDSKPIDARHHGVPLYGRRALDRLRKLNVIVLQRSYYSLAPNGGREKLEDILADDQQLDNLHLSNKFLSKPKEKLDPEQVARELDELLGSAEDVSNEPGPQEEVVPEAADDTEPQEGAEVSFTQYVVTRFDHIQGMIADLSATLPVDTKTHLESIGEGVQAVRGEVETLAEMYLKTATTIEQILTLVREDHDFLMVLREALKPRVAEKTNHVQPI